MLVQRAYKERLYPTREQEQRLQWTLDRCRELYNAALQERRDAYRMAGKSLGFFEQKRELPSVKDVRPEYKDINSNVLQDVVKRVDLSFSAFFRRVKSGEKAGYPRFKGRERYDSFTYPHPLQGWRLEHGGRGPFPVRTAGTPRIPRSTARRLLSSTYGRLVLSNIGSIRVCWSRPLEGAIKTVTIRRDGHHWYVCFSCSLEIEVPAQSARPATAIDVGLEYFATLADGSHVDNPRYLRKAEEVLARRLAALARKKRGSNNRRKAKKLVQEAYRQVRLQRHAFHHEEANKLVAQHGTIGVEDLTIKNMVRRPKPKVDEDKTEETGQTVYASNGASAKGGLNKSISDAAWADFIFILTYKAVSAGVVMVKVPAAGTSQTCSGCGRHAPKDLSERWHQCPYTDCGLFLQRDHNAARVIYQRAGFGGLGEPMLRG